MGSVAEPAPFLSSSAASKTSPTVLDAPLLQSVEGASLAITSLIPQSTICASPVLSLSIIAVFVLPALLAPNAKQDTTS